MTKAASRDGEPLIFFKEVLNEAFRARDAAAYLRRLPVFYGIYFHCPAFTSDYLITHFKL